MAWLTMHIFPALVITICCYSSFLMLEIYIPSINGQLNTVENTLNTKTEDLFNLPNLFEYTINIDPNEVFPNQTIKERILNEFEPAKYSIPKLDYNLLGFNISASEIQIQTNSTKIQDNKTKIDFPIMIAENVKVNTGLKDLSYDNVDLSSIYIIYDQKADEFTVHIPIATASSYLLQ